MLHTEAMKVFDRDPSDWKELQDMVGQLFEEMGCEVEVGKQVLNVRGTKEIDVYVERPRHRTRRRLSLRMQVLEAFRPAGNRPFLPHRDE